MDGMIKWFYCLKCYDRPCGWCMPLGVGSSLVTERCFWCACSAPGLRGESTSAALNIKLVWNKTLRYEQVKGPAADNYLFSPLLLSLPLSHSLSLTHHSSLCARPLLSTSQRHVIVLETLTSGKRQHTSQLSSNLYSHTY